MEGAADGTGVKEPEAEGAAAAPAGHAAGRGAAGRAGQRRRQPAAATAAERVPAPTWFWIVFARRHRRACC